MKKSKMAAAFLAAVLPASLCLTGCFGFMNSFGYTYENADKYTAGNREITEKITAINLDYVSGDVTVKGSDTDTVKVDETSNKPLDEEHKVHTWVNDGILYVRYCASSNMISFNNISKDLEITLPENQALDSFIIKVSSGDTTIRNTTIDSLNVHSSSGNMNLELSASTIELKASSGNIFLNQDGKCDSVDVHSSSGNVALNLCGACDKTKIHASSGSVDVKATKINDLDVDVSSGDITIYAEDAKNLTTKASSGKSDISLVKIPEKSKISCSSGGIELRLPEVSDLTITASITSGDFDSEFPFIKDGKNYICGDGANSMEIHATSGDVKIFKK